MSATTRIESRTYNVPVDNIDTDQIIPAQFLTTTEREGMGQFLFHGWRFDENGTEREEHPLSAYIEGHHEILVAGTNFGCGSSREHAPWALLDFGFRAVISDRFADIFRNNSLKNGLLPIIVDKDVVTWLMQHPENQVVIDIEKRELLIEGLGSYTFPLDPFSAYCLMRGIDQMDFLVQNQGDIENYENSNGK